MNIIVIDNMTEELADLLGAMTSPEEHTDRILAETKNFTIEEHGDMIRVHIHHEELDMFNMHEGDEFELRCELESEYDNLVDGAAMLRTIMEHAVDEGNYEIADDLHTSVNQAYTMAECLNYVLRILESLA